MKALITGTASAWAHRALKFWYDATFSSPAFSISQWSHYEKEAEPEQGVKTGLNVEISATVLFSSWCLADGTLPFLANSLTLWSPLNPLVSSARPLANVVSLLQCLSISFNTHLVPISKLKQPREEFCNCLRSISFFICLLIWFQFSRSPKINLGASLLLWDFFMRYIFYCYCCIAPVKKRSAVSWKLMCGKFLFFMMSNQRCQRFWYWESFF